MKKITRLRLNVNPAGLVKMNNNNQEIDLFNLGTLIQFETHSWQARAQLPKSILKKISPKQAEKWVGGHKKLIDMEHLAEINAIYTEARSLVWDNALPFPIKGLHFIPNEKIPVIKEKLDEFIILLKKKVGEFAKQYDEFITEAKSNLGPDNLFNSEDYPNDIKSRFSISYRFFDIKVPSYIDEKIRAQEVESFKKLMQETKDMGILALREGFAEIVSTITDKLTSNPQEEKKVLRQGAIDKVEEFFQSFQSMNLFKDTELETLILKAKNAIEGVTIKDIKTDKELATAITKEMLTVEKELNKSIKTFRRKISFS